jgi:Tol biopolymer transport system component
VAVGINDLDAHDIHPFIAADGLTLWFASDREGPYGVYVATRPTRQTGWVTAQPIAELNDSAEHAFGFTATSSTLTAVFCVRDGDADTELVLTTRASLSYPWTTPQSLVELDSGANEGGPWLSDDGRALLFSSNAPGGVGEHDLYFARRPAAFGAFEPPEPIAELNTPASDEDPWLLADGRTMYFASSRDGTLDLFVASR